MEAQHFPNLLLLIVLRFVTDRRLVGGISSGKLFRWCMVQEKSNAYRGTGGIEVIIDLGKVVATAEVHVNDSLAGILVTAPWKIDISKWIRKGENKIEILVYNTLANHYLTIPTKYRGNSLQSGLLGPVKLWFYSSVKKD